MSQQPYPDTPHRQDKTNARRDRRTPARLDALTHDFASRVRARKAANVAPVGATLLDEPPARYLAQPNRAMLTEDL